MRSLIFDPYASTVYDYLGGIEDLKKAKVRIYYLAVVVS